MHLKIVNLPTVDGRRWYALIGRRDGNEFNSSQYKYMTTGYNTRELLDHMLKWKIPEFNQGIIDLIFFNEIGDIEYEVVRPRES
jgi:hypothetical protein